MHVILEKIGAEVSPVPIKDPKITALWPSALVIWFGNVHDDGNPVFVVIFDHAVESINCIAFNCAVALLDEFDRIQFGDL